MKLLRRCLFPTSALCAALAVGLVALMTYSVCSDAAAKIIHTEPSEFAPVLVFEEHGERCMNFNSVNDPGRQTCVDLKHPDKMVFAYTRMMTCALFLNPAPANVLIIGLGGATLPRALQKILPRTVIDTVEIDPAVANVAQRFFGYEQSPTQRLFLEDGRAFVERAHREGRQYDMIMLDAFDVDYIPAHLLTREFLQHVRAILTPKGILVANTFTNSKMYDQESVTYADVFGDFFNLRDGNRVIIAARGALPDTARLAANARAMAGTLAPFGIDVKWELRRFSTIPDWDVTAAVLTDAASALVNQ